MENKHTERDGLEAVLAFESEQGRDLQERVHKCGYDLVTKRQNGQDERHIEVKATSKDRFTSRWLEELEQEASETDELFFLYLVTNAGSADVKVWVYDRDRMKSRFSGPTTKYIYTFPSSDFEE